MVSIQQPSASPGRYYDETLSEACEPAPFKSPKVSSLFRTVEQQELIGQKLPV